MVKSCKVICHSITSVVKYMHGIIYWEEFSQALEAITKQALTFTLRSQGLSYEENACLPLVMSYTTNTPAQDVHLRGLLF